jgi:hypothetical protein
VKTGDGAPVDEGTMTSASRSGSWSRKSIEARRLLVGGSAEVPSVLCDVEDSFRRG